MRGVVLFEDFVLLGRDTQADHFALAFDFLHRAR
jgi:hypothetical protein